MKKKVYNLFFILNILCSISIFVNILFLSSSSDLSIISMIGVIIFYIGIIYLYFKNDRDICNRDIIFLSIFSIFLIIYIIFMLFFQSNNSRTYNMLYFSKLLLFPSIIYSLYNLFLSD